jgi:hypothetical protein
MTTLQQMSLSIVLSVAFTEFVEALAVTENFKKRERISICREWRLTADTKVLKEPMIVGRQTNAGDGLMRAEFPKKLPEALRYSEEIWNLLPLCSRGAPHGPLQFRPGQEVREVRLQQICLRLVVCGAGLPHIGDEDQALLLLVTG